jgi:hypothetical protein
MDSLKQFFFGSKPTRKFTKKTVKDPASGEIMTTYHLPASKMNSENREFAKHYKNAGLNSHEVKKTRKNKARRNRTRKA